MDVGFKSGKNIFRYRVAAIVIEEDHLLAATNDMSAYFYVLSGPVTLGEASESSAKNVLFEKTGEEFEADRLLTIVENFFDYEFNDTKHEFQEVTFYYLMKSKSRKTYTRQNSIGGGRTETLEWLPLSRLDNVEFRPKVVKEIVHRLPENVETIISDERMDDFG